MKRRREEKEVCKENTQLYNKNVIQVHYGKIYGCIVENIYGSIIENRYRYIAEDIFRYIIVKYYIPIYEEYTDKFSKFIPDHTGKHILIRYVYQCINVNISRE